MTKASIYGLLAVTLIALGVFHYKLKPQPDPKEIQQAANQMMSVASWQGQIAPNFEGFTITGAPFKLSDNVGKKVIVLNFFATWCKPCRDEMPELNRYFNAHKGQSFEFLAIDSEEHQDRVDGMMKDLSLDFPVLIDQGPVQKQYGVTSFPTTVLIGVDGRVQFYEVGEIANAEVVFDPLIESNRKLSASGKIISPADYIREAAAHPELPRVNPYGNNSGDASDSPKLDERGTRIAAKMDCTCGCDKKVAACTCNASKKIKGALAKEDFKDMKDDAIIRSLNQRFCPGDM